MLQILENIGKFKAVCLCSRCKGSYTVGDKYSARDSRVGHLCTKCKRAVIDMGEPTQEKLQRLFNYDPETGKFTHRYDTLRASAGDELCSTHSQGYITCSFNGKGYLLHRIIFLYVVGRFPEMIDHINHIRNDNRWSNLREVTDLENAKNTSISSNSTSGFNGVSYIKKTGRYRAYVNKNYKQIHIGIYATIEEAIEARKQADIEHSYHVNHGV